MHIETIPLAKLVPSPANVRKAKTDITGLAASIMVHGLLQNLQVCPNGESYEVVAGGRRLAALKYLAKQKKIAADYGVACEVREGPDAVEISLPKMRCARRCIPPTSSKPSKSWPRTARARKKSRRGSASR